MSIWIIVGLVVVCAAGDAAAERAVVVDAVGVPFAATELAAAIRLRVAPDGAPLRIRAVAIDNGVRIEAPGGVRDVVLGALRGVEAARLVALAADDLLLDDVAMPASVVAAAPVPVAAGAPIELGVLGGVAAWSGALPALAIELVVPRDRWLVAFELGGGQLIDPTVSLTAGIARVEVGRRFGLIEARAGVTAVPLIVTTSLGDQTVVVGGNVSARVRLAVGARSHLIAAIGLDGFATRTVYRLGTGATLATPWLAPWLAAGIEVGL